MKKRPPGVSAALVFAGVLVAPACGSGASTVASEPLQASSSTQLVPSSGVVAGALDEAELGAPYLDHFVFDWPRDCAVPVVEEVLKAGRTTSLRYNLGLRGDGQNIIVAFDDLTVTSVDGTEVPESAAQAITANFTLPSFRVGTDGMVIELIGMEAVVEQLEAFGLIGDFGMTPEFAALLEESVVEKYWGSWVGIWANWGYFDEPTELGTSEAPIGGGVAISEVDMESLGAADRSLVALRSTTTLDGADFALAVGGVVDLAADTDDAADIPEFVGQRVSTFEVVTDPATLRAGNGICVDCGRAVRRRRHDFTSRGTPVALRLGRLQLNSRRGRGPTGALAPSGEIVQVHCGRSQRRANRTGRANIARWTCA